MSDFHRLDSNPTDFDALHHAMGVRWTNPAGLVEYTIREGVVWARVGTITVWPTRDIVCVDPRTDLSRAALRSLRGEAVDVAMGRSVPSKSRAWVFFNGKPKCWATNIMIALPENHQSAVAIRAAAAPVTRGAFAVIPGTIDVC